MKWLALVLVIVNAFLWFGSDYWVPDQVRVVISAATLPRVATLKVEAPPPYGAEREIVPVEAAQAPQQPAQQSPPVVPVCVRLGWFETVDKARQAYRSIGSPGDLLLVSEEERALEPLHWVIVPPQPEARALELYNELQRRGIDSYLVTRGENTNAISLGLFQSLDAAERVLAAKKRQNLNAVLANFPRNQISYALVFAVTQAVEPDTGNGRLEDYRDDFEMVEISDCEGVATVPKNP